MTPGPLRPNRRGSTRSPSHCGLALPYMLWPLRNLVQDVIAPRFLNNIHKPPSAFVRARDTKPSACSCGASALPPSTSLFCEPVPDPQFAVTTRHLRLHPDLGETQFNHTRYFTYQFNGGRVLGPAIRPPPLSWGG